MGFTGTHKTADLVLKAGHGEQVGHIAAELGSLMGADRTGEGI